MMVKSEGSVPKMRQGHSGGGIRGQFAQKKMLSLKTDPRFFAWKTKMERQIDCFLKVVSRLVS